MESLPIDMSHPAVRDYLSLVRLQVLTPLSLLINIATVLVCAIVVHPSIGGVSKRFPTSISPNPLLIGVYVMAIYVGQIGYCVLLVLARKPETKRTLVQGVGLALVFSNWVMALWAISWVLEFFIVSTILQGLLLLLLLYSNIVLLVYHKPTRSRPFDMALIHAPMRFFFILPLYLLFPYSLFITLGLYYDPASPGSSHNYNSHAWPGFGVVFGTNLLGLLVIMSRRDFVWCVAATWICVSIWSQKPKVAPVNITVILFTVLHPLALITAFVYSQFSRKNNENRTGPIALPPDELQEEREERPPREVDTEALWGNQADR